MDKINKYKNLIEKKHLIQGVTSVASIYGIYKGYQYMKNYQEESDNESDIEFDSESESESESENENENKSQIRNENKSTHNHNLNKRKKREIEIVDKVQIELEQEKNIENIEKSMREMLMKMETEEEIEDSIEEGPEKEFIIFEEKDSLSQFSDNKIDNNSDSKELDNNLKEDTNSESGTDISNNIDDILKNTLYNEENKNADTNFKDFSWKITINDLREYRNDFLILQEENIVSPVNAVTHFVRKGQLSLEDTTKIYALCNYEMNRPVPLNIFCAISHIINNINNGSRIPDSIPINLF